MEIKLLSEALNIMLKKCNENEWTIDEVVNYLILEFSSSTKEERTRQKEHKRMKKEEWFKDKEPCSLCKDAWLNGYKEGWLGFQTRKTKPMIYYPKEFQ